WAAAAITRLLEAFPSPCEPYSLAEWVRLLPAPSAQMKVKPLRKCWRRDRNLANLLLVVRSAARQLTVGQRNKAQAMTRQLSSRLVSPSIQSSGSFVLAAAGAQRSPISPSAF